MAANERSNNLWLFSELNLSPHICHEPLEDRDCVSISGFLEWRLGVSELLSAHMSSCMDDIYSRTMAREQNPTMTKERPKWGMSEDRTVSDFPEETRSQRGLENLKSLEDRRRNSWIEIVLGETAVCISHTIMCQILCLVFTRITPIYLSHRSDEKSKNSILPWRRGNEIWDRILTHVSLTMMIMTITTTMAANIYMTMIMCQSLSYYLSSPHKSPVRKEPFLFQVLQIRKLEHEG